MVQESLCGYWQAIVQGRIVAISDTREGAEALLIRWYAQHPAASYDD